MALRPCIEPGCPKLTLTTRCPTHHAARQRAKDARRPQRRTYAEQHRRQEIVREWILLNGYWCPGIPGEQPPHPSHDLTADHTNPVAISGDEHGPLTVLCRPCNSRLGQRLTQR